MHYYLKLTVSVCWDYYSNEALVMLNHKTDYDYEIIYIIFHLSLPDLNKKKQLPLVMITDAMALSVKYISQSKGSSGVSP